MTKPDKRMRPAPGWPDGWHTIGGDVVDYDAMLDFDAAILGRKPMSNFDLSDKTPKGFPSLREGEIVHTSFGERLVARDANGMLVLIEPKASNSPPGSPAQSEAAVSPRQDRQEAPQEAAQAHSEAASPLAPSGRREA